MIDYMLKRRDGFARFLGDGRICLNRAGCYADWLSRKLLILPWSESRSFVSHSQMTNTSQSRALSDPRFDVSRAWLRPIFLAQYAGRVETWAVPQPCPCQKQPCTKMTLQRPGNTRSGEPGKSRRCSLNR